MSLKDRLLPLEKKQDADRFLKEFIKALTEDTIRPIDFPFLLKLYRMYKDLIFERNGSIIKAIENANEVGTDNKLFALFVKYELKRDRKKTLEDLTKAFRDYVHYKSSNKFDFIIDDDNAHFFLSYREDDMFHRVVKWYRQLQTNEDFFICEECDSIYSPFFGTPDSYICSNPKCKNTIKPHYYNYCWNCQAPIDSDYNLQCRNCHWYICNSCGKCLKDNGCSDQQPIQKKILSVIDFNNDDNFLEKYYQIAIKKIKKELKNKVNVNKIDRGRKILETDQELNYYLAAYGRHHIVKLKKAIEKIAIDGDEINIYDWGCGQGIGTITLLEKIFEVKKIKNVSKIFLIEPSTVAIKKAEKLILEYLKNKQTKPSIFKIPIEFDKIKDKDIECICSGKDYHIFSNILDVSFDIDNLIKALKKNLRRDSLFICTNPNYPTARKRIDYFYKNLSKEEKYRLINVDNTSLRTMIYDINKNREMLRYVKRYEVSFHIAV